MFSNNIFNNYLINKRAGHGTHKLNLTKTLIDGNGSSTQHKKGYSYLLDNNCIPLTYEITFPNSTLKMKKELYKLIDVSDPIRWAEEFREAVLTARWDEELSLNTLRNLVTAEDIGGHRRGGGQGGKDERPRRP